MMAYTHGMEDNRSSAAKKRRRTRGARTALACVFCRHRKIRCSGDWPTCSACSSRGRDCVYPGLAAPPGVELSQTNRNPVLNNPDDNEVEVYKSIAEDPGALSRSHCRRALAIFRETYASTLLFFLRPQQLIEDECGDDLPAALLLCIVALATKSMKEDELGSASNFDADYYAELARKELNNTYDEPSLDTIQCCLILCVLEIGEGSELSGWLRLGHAAKLAQLMQLHKLDSNLGLMDWGRSATPLSPALAEAKRRTFWSCFCLERLLANGRDRVFTFLADDITTQFPQTEQNFIYGSMAPTCSLHCEEWSSGTHSHLGQETVLSYTIRVINILSNIITWNGRGGRHVDKRCPWEPDMAFTQFDEALKEWESAIPACWKYTPQNVSATMAMGTAKLWSIMWMVYFQARTYLHREYMPFTPKIHYDPARGPCDGPTFGSEPPVGFWMSSAKTMIEGANEITRLYHMMQARGLAVSAYPIPGLGLLTAASIHVVYTIFSWKSMEHIIEPEESRNYLKQDMCALNDLGQKWSLAIHWVRQISSFYKLNRLTKRSWESQSQENAASSMNIKEIKDGIMNFVRQIGLHDRRARDVNLKPTFDFEGWLDALEDSASQGNRSESRSQLSQNVQGIAGFPTTPTSNDFNALGFVNSPPGLLCFDWFTGMAMMSDGNMGEEVEAWTDRTMD